MYLGVLKGRLKTGLSAAGVKITACKLATNHSVAAPQMPKIRTSRTKKPPEGFEEIEQVCTALNNHCLLVSLLTRGPGRFWMIMHGK